MKQIKKQNKKILRKLNTFFDLFIIAVKIAFIYIFVMALLLYDNNFDIKYTRREGNVEVNLSFHLFTLHYFMELV